MHLYVKQWACKQYSFSTHLYMKQWACKQYSSMYLYVHMTHSGLCALLVMRNDMIQPQLAANFNELCISMVKFNLLLIICMALFNNCWNEPVFCFNLIMTLLMAEIIKPRFMNLDDKNIWSAIYPDSIQHVYLVVMDL